MKAAIHCQPDFGFTPGALQLHPGAPVGREDQRAPKEPRTEIQLGHKIWLDRTHL